MKIHKFCGLGINHIYTQVLWSKLIKVYVYYIKCLFDNLLGENQSFSSEIVN